MTLSIAPPNTSISAGLVEESRNVLDYLSKESLELFGFPIQVSVVEELPSFDEPENALCSFISFSVPDEDRVFRRANNVYYDYMMDLISAPLNNIKKQNIPVRVVNLNFCVGQTGIVFQYEADPMARMMYKFMVKSLIPRFSRDLYMGITVDDLPRHLELFRSLDFSFAVEDMDSILADEIVIQSEAKTYEYIKEFEPKGSFWIGTPSIQVGDDAMMVKVPILTKKRRTMMVESRS